MIVVELAGGLGNQCFQYAAARSLADRVGVNVGLDVRTYHAANSRPYGLDAFNIRAVVVPDADLFGVHGPRSWRRELASGLVERVLVQMRRPRLSSLRRLVHQGSAYTDMLTHAADDSWLCGYWQSERYFAGNAARVRADLTLAAVSAKTSALQRAIQAMVFPVAVHVRRGDYAAVASTRAYHGLCEPEYYRAAIGRIRERHPMAQCVFFSDEPDWAAANLQSEIDVLVRPEATGRPQDDLHLMAHCRAHVIANSSFSWWGAWLANSDLVVAPRRWFQASGVDESAVVPERWIRL